MELQYLTLTTFFTFYISDITSEQEMKVITRNIRKAKEPNPDKSLGYCQFFEDDAEFADFVNYCMPNP